MMSYRSISYILCIIALIFCGTGIASADDDLEDFLDGGLDDAFSDDLEILSDNLLFNTTDIPEGILEEVQEPLEPLFATIFEFESSPDLEELIKSCQTEVDLTDDAFILAEAVFSSALVNTEEVEEFEMPSTLQEGAEELPIAPISLEAEEIPTLMLQLASVEPSSLETGSDVQAEGMLSAASVASTVAQSSSAIVQGFSSVTSVQFTSSFFSSSSSRSAVAYSYYFSDPYRDYFRAVTSTYMTLVASPENPRPGEYLTLAGKLADQFGRPIPGAQVRIIRTDERGTTAIIGTAITDFSGTYVFRTIATPGVYWYVSEYRQMPGLVTLGYSNSVRVICASYQNWGVTLTATPTVGYVGDRMLLYGFVTADGFPVGGGAPVELQYQYGGKWYRMVQRQTDGQGIFAYPLQATSPGTITVRAVFYDPYGMQKISNPVVLNTIGIPTPIPPQGSGGAVLTLYTQSPNLPSFGSTTVYGWLTTRSGVPLGGMPIAIQSQMQQGGRGGMQSTEYRNTRANGSFDITVVASEGSGTITAQAAFPGSGPYPPVESRPVTISFGGGGPAVQPPVKTPTKAPQTTSQVQITAQYSPPVPRAGQDVTVSGTLTTITGQPVTGVLIDGVSTIQSGRCQATAQNKIPTDAAGRYQYVFQPSCDGEAHVTVKFDGTTQYRPVSISFVIPIDRYQANPAPAPSYVIPMDPIVMMSLP